MQHQDARSAVLVGPDQSILVRFKASQARVGAAIGMNQGCVNEIINGLREASHLDVFERIADGLSMPDDARHLLGLAPQREERAGGAAFDFVRLPAVVRGYSEQAAAAEEIQQCARATRELDVLAVRGLGLLGLRNSLLRPHLDRDGGDPPSLRVLLLDPDSDAMAQRASEIGESTESLAGGVPAR
ncbi:hypothetical protein OG455_30530 [Kitasatospora sp. NBC_01287]|uniref:hypothetical protein n=1 Tax=Kitasatospora sp. NBC_01287 TaxID=2903573 RepID=UPI00225B8186|nr:hypothetical protein [Kitasatospora sp. NBC_01287]MCX4749801.1 hypothetical protein [Kitasatospora sp. NBC_01287]